MRFYPATPLQRNPLFSIENYTTQEIRDCTNTSYSYKTIVNNDRTLDFKRAPGLLQNDRDWQVCDRGFFWTEKGGCNPLDFQTPIVACDNSKNRPFYYIKPDFDWDGDVKTAGRHRCYGLKIYARLCDIARFQDYMNSNNLSIRQVADGFDWGQLNLNFRSDDEIYLYYIYKLGKQNDNACHRRADECGQGRSACRAAVLDRLVEMNKRSVDSKGGWLDGQKA